MIDQELFFYADTNMPMNKIIYSNPPFSSLTFANGQKFLLHPTDAQAAEVVARFSDVMQLSPGTDGCEIFICVSDKIIPDIRPQKIGPLVCSLLWGIDEFTILNQMSQLARYISGQMILHGGILIHGGLVMHNGQGIILAAEGGVGKSTACNRLPEFWKALSDDATMVVQKDDGRYFAHPWPTWSRFLEGKSEEVWNVEQAIPLSSIFFLQQSLIDRVEQLPRGNAIYFIMESIRQVMLFPLVGEIHSDIMEEPLNFCLSAAERLVSSVPIHILQISLGGTFWVEISKALQNPGVSAPSSQIPMSPPPINTPYRFFDEQSIPIIYSGPSMDPTFRDADLLEVIPYGSGSCRVGDVICFFSPEKNKRTIHRIISIHKNGIQTKGDNNSTPDPNLIKPDEILGKVVTISRVTGTRTVMGGTPGIILHTLLQTRRSIWQRIYPIIIPLIRIPNPIGFVSHFTRRCFSTVIKPRFFLFSTRYCRNIKLYIGNHLAGEYNTYRKTWIIRSPFSLFIDKDNLPIVEEPGSNYENLKKPT